MTRKQPGAEAWDEGLARMSLCEARIWWGT